VNKAGHLYKAGSQTIKYFYCDFNTLYWFSLHFIIKDLIFSVLETEVTVLYYMMTLCQVDRYQNFGGMCHICPRCILTLVGEGSSQMLIPISYTIIMLVFQVSGILSFSLCSGEHKYGHITLN